MQGGVWKISAAVDPGKPPNLHVRREGRGGGFCPAPSTTPIMVTITDICHNQYLLLRVVATRGGSVLIQPFLFFFFFLFLVAKKVLFVAAYFMPLLLSCRIMQDVFYTHGLIDVSVKNET